MVLNGAATVTLCWRQKASHFWIMLLLVSGTADHGWICIPLSIRSELLGAVVCTENFVRIDYVTESPNVSGDDRPVLPPPHPVRLAVQVQEPT